MGNSLQQNKLSIENFFPINWTCANPNCNKKSCWWGITNKRQTAVYELCQEHGSYMSKYLKDLKEREKWFISTNKNLDETEAKIKFMENEISKNILHSLEIVSPMNLKCHNRECSSVPSQFGIAISYVHGALCVVESCNEHAVNSRLQPLQNLINKLIEKSKGNHSPEEVVSQLNLNLDQIKELSENWYDLNLKPQHLEGLNQLAYALKSTTCHWCKNATFKTNSKFCGEVCEDNLRRQEREAEILASEAELQSKSVR